MPSRVQLPCCGPTGVTGVTAPLLMSMVAMTVWLRHCVVTTSVLGPSHGCSTREVQYRPGKSAGGTGPCTTGTTAREGLLLESACTAQAIGCYRACARVVKLVVVHRLLAGQRPQHAYAGKLARGVWL
jgi:hypothetical protein